MKTQYNVLGYRIYLYFHDYKLAIENNENGHNDWNTGYEIKKQTTIEQELICKFTKIDPDKDEFYICRAISEICTHIKQQTKKTLINKTSARLIRHYNKTKSYEIYF